MVLVFLACHTHDPTGTRIVWLQDEDLYCRDATQDAPAQRLDSIRVRARGDRICHPAHLVA